MSILGKEQWSSYGSTSCVVTAPSAGSSLTFLQLQVPLGVFSFPIRWLEEEQLS